MKKINNDKITSDFYKLLESLSDEQWKLKVNKNWTIKDVVAHLVGWEYEAGYELTKAWETKQEPWFLKTGDYLTFNQTNINRFGKLTPKDLLQEWKKWQRTLEEVIMDVGEENLRAEPEIFSWVFDEEENSHYLYHYNQIKNVLERP